MRPDRTISELAYRLWRVGLLGVGTVILGTAGFAFIEGWSLVESLYMTAITISTVGFAEVQPLSSAGQIFTIFLIIIGVSNFAYFFGTIGEFVVSDQLSGSIRRRKMRRDISESSGHYIICGFGRVGAQVAEDLQNAKAEFVVIEPDSQTTIPIPDEYLQIAGDASDDDTLLAAGIERAAGLVAVTGDDARNTFITLSARTLNSELSIVARSNDHSTDSKLLRAGANHVVSPYIISGRKIATQLLNPSITRFLDGVMPTGTDDLWMEELTITSQSALDTQTLASADVRARTGAFILAVRKSDETVISNPPANMELAAGDTLISFGTREQLTKLQEFAG